jgi:hypothetical protein
MSRTRFEVACTLSFLVLLGGCESREKQKNQQAIALIQGYHNENLIVMRNAFNTLQNIPHGKDIIEHSTFVTVLSPQVLADTEIKMANVMAEYRNRKEKDSLVQDIISDIDHDITAIKSGLPGLKRWRDQLRNGEKPDPAKCPWDVNDSEKMKALSLTFNTLVEMFSQIIANSDTYTNRLRSL